MTGQLDLTALAEQIAPRIAAQHGPNATAEQRCDGIYAYLAQHGMTLDETSIEMLMDDVKDLVPTY